MIVFYNANINTINFNYAILGLFFVNLYFNLNNNSMKTNSIGLDLKKAAIISAELNILLANFQVYYQNLRGLHWNIRGKRFFE